MTSKLALFDQILVASLIQPLNLNQPDFKAYKTLVRLKLTEQRNEASGDKELKFEISRADDYEFLFAEILNNEKYQKLAREHDLTVDFDTFPKVIIQHLLCKNIVHNQEENGENEARKKPGYHSIIDNGRPTEINITLDAEKNYCLFELFSKTPISKGRIFSMKLMAVRGDHLISHLLKICSSQGAKLSSFQKTSEELSIMKKKFAELENDKNRFQGVEEKLDEISDRNRELEDELQLVKEERETIRVLAEEKEDMAATLQDQLHSLNQTLEENKEELEIVGKMLREEQSKTDQAQKMNSLQQKEMSKLRAEIGSLSRNLEKADNLLKRNDQQQNQQSVDVRKLKELEADLKEKDSIVESLTETVSHLRKELEDEKVKLREVVENFERLKLENEENKRKLAMYRNQRYSPAPVAALPLGTLGTAGFPPGYQPVLGPNSPYAPANFRTPFREVTPPNDTPPTRLNNSTPILRADQTNGSSATNTPHFNRRTE